jgi:AcrR family transcriptional regulator
VTDVQVVETDGRRLRREANREAVLDALVGLFAEGNYQPGTLGIAERAGISHRSLFRYFDDIDDLHRAAIERQLRDAQPLLDPGVGVDAPTAAKVEGIAAARVRLYEVIAPAARAARAAAHRLPLVAAQLHESRSYLRRQLRHLLTPELAGERAALLPAVDVLCSFETYDLLRVEQGLSVRQTEAAITDALAKLLA